MMQRAKCGQGLDVQAASSPDLGLLLFLRRFRQWRLLPELRSHLTQVVFNDSGMRDEFLDTVAQFSDTD